MKAPKYTRAWSKIDCLSIFISCLWCTANNSFSFSSFLVPSSHSLSLALLLLSIPEASLAVSVKQFVGGAAVDLLRSFRQQTDTTIMIIETTKTRMERRGFITKKITVGAGTSANIGTNEHIGGNIWGWAKDIDFTINIITNEENISSAIGSILLFTVFSVIPKVMVQT